MFVAAVASVTRLPASPMPWLLTVAKRRWIDYVRSSSRRPLESLDETVAAPVEEPVETISLAATITEAIEALPSMQRRVLVEHLLEQRSFAEIAVRVYATEAACKMRFARAVAAVQRTLEAAGIHGGV